MAKLYKDDCCNHPIETIYDSHYEIGCAGDSIYIDGAGETHSFNTIILPNDFAEMADAAYHSDNKNTFLAALAEKGFRLEEIR